MELGGGASLKRLVNVVVLVTIDDVETAFALEPFEATLEDKTLSSFSPIM